MIQHSYDNDNMRTTLCKNRLPKKRSSMLTCFRLANVRLNLEERFFNNLVLPAIYPSCLPADIIRRQILGNLFLQRLVGLQEASRRPGRPF